VEKDKNGIWNEVESPSFSPVLRKPNHYQTRIKFIEQWIVSKLVHGNAYALKERDGRGVVTALYLLDPQRVRVLVAPNGDVFYEAKRDDLSQLPLEQYVFPAREIGHDVGVAFYHPLVGLSPISACGVSAIQGLRIQENSTKFFANGASPSGLLTAPAGMSQKSADDVKAAWQAGFTGSGIGKIAVLGADLKYTPLTMTSVDAQLIEQLKMTSEMVCSAFHVPGYMVGVGPLPTYANAQSLSLNYYTQCLQSLIESLEATLDEALGLGPQFGNQYGVEFNTDDLLRMDSATMVETLGKAVDKALMSPDEGRFKLNLKPVPGGNTPYLQQQMYSLAALNKRDQAPPSPPIDARAPLPKPEPDDDEEPPGAAPRFAASLMTKVVERMRHAA
jgi:HK97 family phage portal protein